MTCIVGLIDKKNKSVYIGADSAGVAGLDITIRKDQKVFKVGDFVIGCTSSFRMIQLLRFSLKLPDVCNKDIYEYMCTDFINSVRECFKNGGFMQSYKDGDEKGGCFLVGYKGRLFKVSDDYQVGESFIEFDSIGCGESYALGALYSMKNNDLSVEDKVRKSLEIAEYFSAGVKKPFVILKTK